MDYNEFLDVVDGSMVDLLDGDDLMELLETGSLTYVHEGVEYVLSINVSRVQ